MSGRRSVPALLNDSGGIPHALACVGFCAWLVVTASNQEPTRALNRLIDLSRIRRMGLSIPDFRFFAPEPGTHDLHLMHRVVTHDGVLTSFTDTLTIEPRSWRHLVWFPERRRNTGTYNICAELFPMLLGIDRVDDVTETVPYRLLSRCVAINIAQQYAGEPAPLSYQCAIARGTGYDPRPPRRHYVRIFPMTPYDPTDV